MVRTEDTSETVGQARTAVATDRTLTRESGKPMSAVCSICRREDRTAIEQSHVAGMSLRAIAKLHAGTTAWSLRRHFAHVPVIIENQQKLERQQERNDRATAKLPTRVEHLLAELERMTLNANRRRDYSAALRAITARLQCLRTIGELSGELRPRPGAGEVVPGTVTAGASVTLNLPQATAVKDPARFVALLNHIYGLDEDYSRNRAAAANPPKIM